MENDDITKLISLTSVWEMGIKQSKGKLTLAVPLEQYIQDKLTLEDYEILPITLKQLAKITTLPFHHNDPFDRLLISQAMTEQIPLVSKDTAFEPY